MWERDDEKAFWCHKAHMKQLDTNIKWLLLARVAFPKNSALQGAARRGEPINPATPITFPRPIHPIYIYNGGHHHLRDQARSKSPLAPPGFPLDIRPSHHHHIVPGQLDHRSPNRHLCNHHPQSYRHTIRPSPCRVWSSSIAAISQRTF